MFSLESLDGRQERKSLNGTHFLFSVFCCKFEKPVLRIDKGLLPHFMCEIAELKVPT